MEGLRNVPCLNAALATLLIFSVISVNAQISTPCTNSMINSFTPCLNYITGSIGNSRTSPTVGCCDSVKALMSTSMDCACLIITGNVPFSLPINRTLAISLPRSCKTSGVPIQCKAAGVPLPAPGPVLFGPTLAPAADSPFSPRASKAVATAPPPVDLAAASPPVAPIATPGVRPVLTPVPASSSNPSYTSSSPFILLLVFLFLIVFNHY